MVLLNVLVCFAEALRTGFFEYQALRDTYREVTMGDMNQTLIKKFIETQAIILSPICPHVAEHIWSLIGKKESILKSSWPTVPMEDPVLIRAGNYLDQTAHDFRLRMKAYLSALTSKGNKKGAAPVKGPVQQPTHATIWIAKTYPSWQLIILTVLRDSFKVSLLTDGKNKRLKINILFDLMKFRNM